MTNLDNYKVEHLFLLVGENPLPNYIAARTLLENGGTVYLVFTEHTKPQKNCLFKQIKGQKTLPIAKKVELVDLGNDESDSYQISDRIKKRIKAINSGRIGLNYTGGTKAMAVHAYRAVQEAQPDAVFSYLDSRHLSMCIDREKGSPISCKVDLVLSFKELFDLHNLKWQNNQPPSPEPTLPDAATEFAKFYENTQLANYWKNWCQEYLRPKTKKDDKWKPEEELQKQSIITLQGLPNPIKKILCEYLDASESADMLKLDVTQKKGFKDLSNVCAWLDGIWLEDYVLQQVKQVSPRYPINDKGISFRIEDPEKTWREKFEFDVAFMVGYQLFALSCTTSSNKKLCKQKLIEAHLRARQLGGDEARVALVCFYDTPSYIKAELRTTIQDRKIEVFGRDDILKLSEKIGGWIERNNQEAKK
ncbi:DUF1887 family CARF protein [Laspinema sp. D1]|uniref:Card1-like endonuclease domain-containing protein n=1 Tax=Laspinema palackyanum TaxID=3231601 RepID=UPI00349345EF|nr:DUF1887 family CARF protein [Laspinema sp. D2b]